MSSSNNNTTSTMIGEGGQKRKREEDDEPQGSSSEDQGTSSGGNSSNTTTATTDPMALFNQLRGLVHSDALLRAQVLSLAIEIEPSLGDALGVAPVLPFKSSQENKKKKKKKGQLETLPFSSDSSSSSSSDREKAKDEENSDINLCYHGHKHYSSDDSSSTETDYDAHYRRYHELGPYRPRSARYGDVNPSSDEEGIMTFERHRALNADHYQPSLERYAESTASSDSEDYHSDYDVDNPDSYYLLQCNQQEVKSSAKHHDEWIAIEEAFHEEYRLQKEERQETRRLIHHVGQGIPHSILQRVVVKKEEEQEEKELEEEVEKRLYGEMLQDMRQDETLPRPLKQKLQEEFVEIVTEEREEGEGEEPGPVHIDDLSVLDLKVQSKLMHDVIESYDIHTIKLDQLEAKLDGKHRILKELVELYDEEREKEEGGGKEGKAILTQAQGMLTEVETFVHNASMLQDEVSKEDYSMMIQQVDSTIEKFVTFFTDAKPIQQELEAFYEMKTEQSCVDRICSRQAFFRFTRELIQNYKTDVNITRTALDILQLVTEDYLIDMFTKANVIAIHAGREYVTDKDLAVTQYVAGKLGMPWHVR